MIETMFLIIIFGWNDVTFYTNKFIDFDQIEKLNIWLLPSLYFQHLILRFISQLTFKEHDQLLQVVEMGKI